MTNMLRVLPKLTHDEKMAIANAVNLLNPGLISNPKDRVIDFTRFAFLNIDTAIKATDNNWWHATPLGYETTRSALDKLKNEKALYALDCRVYD